DFAEMASIRGRSPIPPSKEAESDSAVQYWSALRILMVGKDAVTKDKIQLKGMLENKSPSVRVVAAEALATFGEANDIAPSLKTLLAHADAKKNSLYVSLAALNAIDRLGEKARPIAKELRALPTEPTDAKHRAAMGVSRLLTSINGRLGNRTQ